MSPEQEHEGAELPTASLALLISNFATQAMIELGEIKNPVTHKTAIAPERAKLTIDLLQVIRDKTTGNLTPEEQRFIDAALYELRLKYVAVMRK